LNDEIMDFPGQFVGSTWYIIAAFLGDQEFCAYEFGFAMPMVSGYGPFVFTVHDVCWPTATAGLTIPSGGFPNVDGGGIAVTAGGGAGSWVGNFLTVYWFTGYNSPYQTGSIQLTTNPGTPNDITFADCTGAEFAAACLGAIGFGQGALGLDCCPQEPQPDPWACCLYDGTCVMVLELECQGVWYEGLTCDEVDCPFPVVCCVDHDCYFVHPAECDLLGGVQHPEWPDCTDNPCEELTPADDTSWGTIKAIYR
jgi:hypothetical protein